MEIETGRERIIERVWDRAKLNQKEKKENRGIRCTLESEKARRGWKWHFQSHQIAYKLATDETIDPPSTSPIQRGHSATVTKRISVFSSRLFWLFEHIPATRLRTRPSTHVSLTPMHGWYFSEHLRIGAPLFFTRHCVLAFVAETVGLAITTCTFHCTRVFGVDSRISRKMVIPVGGADFIFTVAQNF